MSMFLSSNKNVLALAVAALSFSVCADDVELSVVEVSAAPIDSAVQQAHADRRQASQSKVVIEAEQLNQFGDQPLGDAMRRLVGVSFSGANRAREVQLRGLGSEYAQVLVDGRRLLDANSKRSLQLDRIPSSLVERVEINRSPTASQEGQGAAGTVNIVLKKQAKGAQGELGLGVGHLQSNGDLGDATAFYTLGSDTLTLNLAGGVQRQRRSEGGDSFAFDKNGKAGGELGENARRFEQQNLMPSLVWQIDDRNQLQLQLDYLQTIEYREDSARELEKAQHAIKRSEYEDRRRERNNLGLLTDWTQQWSAATQLNFSLDLQRADEDTSRNAQRYKANLDHDRSRQRSETIHLTSVSPAFSASTEFDRHTLHWGAGARQETRAEDNTDVENGVLKPFNAARTFHIREEISHAFVQDTWLLPWGDSINYGLRLEDAHTRVRDAYGAKQQSSKLSALPSLSYVGNLTADTQWRLSLARTLRRPDMRELSPTVSAASGTLAKPDTAGNANLRVENISGVDLGIDHYLYDQRGLLSANIFARRFSDKIETVMSQQANGRWLSSPENVGRGDALGLELEVRLPMDAFNLPALTLWSNATFINTRLDSEASDETRRFMDQPDYLINAGADYYWERMRTTLGVNYNWNSGYQQSYRAADGGYMHSKQSSVGRVDLSARTQLTKNTSVNLSLLNVFAQEESAQATTFDRNGRYRGDSLSDEATYRTVYLRLQTAF